MQVEQPKSFPPVSSRTAEICLLIRSAVDGSANSPPPEAGRLSCARQTSPCSVFCLRGVDVREVDEVRRQDVIIEPDSASTFHNRTGRWRFLASRAQIFVAFETILLSEVRSRRQNQQAKPSLMLFGPFAPPEGVRLAGSFAEQKSAGLPAGSKLWHNLDASYSAL